MYKIGARFSDNDNAGPLPPPPSTTKASSPTTVAPSPRPSSTTSDNYRYQNIYLVPKSFDIYRVLCIYGGALLEPPKCYKIPEKHPPNLSNSSSDVYVVWLFNKVFCWLWRNLSNLKTGLPRICHTPHFFINYSISRPFFAVKLIAFQDIFRDE